MRTRIVKIGNSQGVRIPKALLEQTGLRGEVEMSVQDGALVIARAELPRQGWAEGFSQMALHGDDELFDGDLATTGPLQAESWEWE